MELETAIPFLLIITLALDKSIAQDEPSFGSPPSDERSLSVPSVVTPLTRDAQATPMQTHSKAVAGIGSVSRQYDPVDQDQIRQSLRPLALPPVSQRSADTATDHSEKERPVHYLASESSFAEGGLVSHVDGSHPNHDFSGQKSGPLPTPTPQAGTLFKFLQPIPYAEAWALQKQLQKERIAERQGDALLLLEHSPVYTLGRTTQPTHWTCGEEALRRTGASLQSVDRGGSITYHGPGQVVGYPILKLSSYCSGPKQYVRKLEEVLIHTLLRWGIAGYRMEKRPGVWVRWNHADAKIAAIGVRIDHGVTIHGFALNVDLDLSPFSHITPCGLTQCHITSMAEVRQSLVSSSAVAQQVAQEFARTFNIQWMSLLPNSIEKGHHNHQLPSTPLLLT